MSIDKAKLKAEAETIEARAVTDVKSNPKTALIVVAVLALIVIAFIVF